MDTSWAAEHLQTIRTLMERSALYRRALAPIMIIIGTIGLGGGVVAWLVPLQSNRAFSLFWMAMSLGGLISALLLVRRQALRACEPFWSLPTRRVTQALLPQFLTGFVSGALVVILDDRLPPVTWLVAGLWTLFYGFALHSAGFFMQRGIKFLGWLFVLGGAGSLMISVLVTSARTPRSAHLAMALFFGLLHLAYGIYLYFTEKTRRVV